MSMVISRSLMSEEARMKVHGYIPSLLHWVVYCLAPCLPLSWRKSPRPGQGANLPGSNGRPPSREATGGETRAYCIGGSGAVLQFSTGPGAGANWAGTGLQSIPSTCIGGRGRASFRYFGPSAFHDEPEPGGTSSDPEHRPYRHSERHNYGSAVQGKPKRYEPDYLVRPH